MTLSYNIVKSKEKQRKMIKRHCWSNKKICIILFTSLLLGVLNGCRTAQEKILDNLKDAYGTEFAMESFARVGAAYEPICYPVDDPSLLFLGVFDERSEIVMDGYVAALIGKDNSIFLQECIGDDLGESFISRGMGLKMLNYDSEEFRPIHDLFINENFSSERVYEIIKGVHGDYSESCYFIILINTNYTSDIGYGKEYDVLKNASEKLIAKYNDDYGIEVGIIYMVFFLEDKDYAYAKEALEQYHPEMETFSKYISNENYICFATENNKEDYVWSAILSKDEYINEREDMK